MNPIVGLSLGRILVGLASLLRPDLTRSVLGQDPAAGPQLDFGYRLFGSREIALGAATLLARGSGRRSMLLLGVGVDAADAAASVVAHREKALDPIRAVGFTAIATIAVVQGLAGLRGK